MKLEPTLPCGMIALVYLALFIVSNIDNSKCISNVINCIIAFCMNILTEIELNKFTLINNCVIVPLRVNFKEKSISYF